MKPTADMSTEALAALVCSALSAAGVTVTLTGGGCVAIWSEGRYVSRDLDFVEDEPTSRRAVVRAMTELGFKEHGRHFAHPETSFYVEFPSGPLMVGDEPVRQVSKRSTPTGHLRLLSPTDCVKDRLAAFYHWNDRPSLEQALHVARAQRVDLADIRRWSEAEAHAEKHRIFSNRLKSK